MNTELQSQSRPCNYLNLWQKKDRSPELFLILTMFLFYDDFIFFFTQRNLCGFPIIVLADNWSASFEAVVSSGILCCIMQYNDINYLSLRTEIPSVTIHQLKSCRADLSCGAGYHNVQGRSALLWSLILKAHIAYF